MMDDTHGKKEEANTSTKLADSMMESITVSVSKLRCGDPPTIYKVPQRFRQGNEAAYEPQIVSIGPFHKGANESLQGMEQHKWLYLHSFISRNRNRNPKHHLEDYIKAMEELEDKARSWYSDNIGPQVGNEFVKMMVLDACFIVEFFLRFTNPIENILTELDLSSAILDFFLYSGDFKEPIPRPMASLIGYDILLLENQIPFFLLQRIFEMACPLQDVPYLLEKMALHFFDQFMPRNEKIKFENPYYHLLHLFHSHLIPTPTDGEEHNLLCNPIIKYVLNMLKDLLMLLPCSKEVPLPKPQMIPCAVDLELAGVEFKKKEKSNGILNVEFSHGVLEIPLLLIQDCSETLFRNLVAFEHCYPGAGIYFTTYLVFMDFLLNTSKDVALLRRNGIIDNLLGSDKDVAHLFNRLCIGIFHNFKGSYLSDVKDNVQKHCENKWYMWGASLKRKYFTNPWSVISLFAASILLLLTITGTVFTILSYYQSTTVPVLDHHALMV